MTKLQETNLLRRFHRWGKKLDQPNHIAKTDETKILYIIRDEVYCRNHVFSFDAKTNEWLSKNVVSTEHFPYYFS